MKQVFRVVILMVSLVGLAQLAIAQEISIDPNSYYRLTTNWQGEGKSLDVINDGTNNQLQLADTGHYTGQYWKLTDQGGGYYSLSSLWQGEGKSIDVINDGTNNRVHLADTGNYSGQKWMLSPMGGGFYRLTTSWLGEGKSLDVVNDGTNNRLQLADSGGYTGQMWKLTRTNMAVVNLEAGPIWDQADAEAKCPALANQQGGQWTGNWVTTVESAMSVCNIAMIRPFTADIEAGPLWNQGDADSKCPALASQQGGTWTGGWVTTVESAMSVCNISFAGPVTVDLEAGPVWDQADAEAKCSALAGQQGGTWTGGWLTTVQNEMSVCNITLARPVTVNLEAGPLWNQGDADSKCPALASQQGGQWNGNWVTTVESAMSVCSIDF